MEREQLREQVFQKYDGHCAYCGYELKKGWHIDHIKPIKRVPKRFQYGAWEGVKMECPENDVFENKVPSCPSCNINKHSMSVEQFRDAIQNFMKHLNNISTQYKIAKRFGLVNETGIRVQFYYEQFEKKGRKMKIKDPKELMNLIFVCPDCGGDMFGTSHSGEGLEKGHCHNYTKNGKNCGFTWVRPKNDHIVFHQQKVT